MKFADLFVRYVNQEKEEHKREIGRYWSSEIHAIKKGYLKPEEFFKKRIIDEKGTRMILTGLAFEDKLEKILTEMKIDYEYQAKKEIELDDFVLVVKPDFVFKDFVLETKFPFSPIKDEIPERYLDQLEAEYRAFYKPVWLGAFSIPFQIRFFEFTPSRRRWKNIITSLATFHQKLKIVAPKGSGLTNS